MKSLLLSFCLMSVAAPAAVLEFHGRVWVGAVPFVGPGQFVFAIVDETGDPLWTSGAVPEAASTNAIEDALTLTVSNGHYQVRLGDPELNQPPLEDAKILTAPGCALRSWFNDGTNGWHRAGPDLTLDDLLREARTDYISSDQAEAILRGLRALRERLEQEDAAAVAARATGGKEFPTTIVPVGNVPSQGRTNAPLVLVEFVDYACPFSRKLHEQIIPELRRRYVDTGKVRVLTRHYATAGRADVPEVVGAVWCAGQQDHVGAFQDELFKRRGPIALAELLGAAAGAGMDTNQLAGCVAEADGAARFRQDVEAGRRAGVRGTPTLIIGTVDEGRVIGPMIMGVQPLAVYDAIIKAGLREKP